jgi:citrate lyase subunit beta-like protein
MDSLRAECEQGASFGFTGKQAIHPSQISIIQETFAPAKETVNHAIRLLSQYVKEAGEGKRGAWEFEGKMIDRPVIRKAKYTVRLGQTYDIEKAAAESVLEQLSKIGEKYDSDEIDSLRKYL